MKLNLLLKNELIENFNNVFSNTNHSVYFSPGRVNLIGEHIDYNGGFVFPAAISYGTYGVASLNETQNINIYSKGFSKMVDTFSLNDLSKKDSDGYLSYIKGIFYTLKMKGIHIVKGLDIYIESTLPTSSGLSSSASLEMLIIYILNDIYKLNLTTLDMVNISKETENKYVGVHSGIMDQFAVGFGKYNHAILLDTQTLFYEHIPFDLKNYRLLIINSNKPRQLAASKYNERFGECQETLQILKKHFSIEHLCELEVSDLPQIKALLSDTLYRRIKHCITEQTRVIQSKKALIKGDILSFGNAMNLSHESLRYDYEVSVDELDTIVDVARNSGAIGARMTGAGFGGCAIAIVEDKFANHVKEKILTTYQQKFSMDASIYEVEISSGTHKL